ncbi:urease accessory protein D isoform X1 [Canna indica]|uniref:Urease accessory protein D isoform X1 n=1 Tax=Canna indica TaxID=4628 RepID=A0AAQ3KQ71_9LILI|nr:urease accessory protein D isoform X1 [Canna indica]
MITIAFLLGPPCLGPDWSIDSDPTVDDRKSENGGSPGTDGYRGSCSVSLDSMDGEEEEKKKGRVKVENVGGKSTVTRCFSCYPLKLILPNKAGSSKSDAVWIYALSYGGGIVSGDRISLAISVGDGCTAILTTQASTKVYKSVDSKCSEQILEARVGRDALLAVIPDPVTCFATARYSQKQVFRLYADSSLVLVDWITSGRHESGERWEFDLYRSMNHIYLEEDQPLFIDSVLLDKTSDTSIAERMQGYQVMAMVVISGPKLKDLRHQLQEEVKQMMSARSPNSSRNYHIKSEFQHSPTRLPLIASCSPFGPQVSFKIFTRSLVPGQPPKGIYCSVFTHPCMIYLAPSQALGVVVRIAATTTHSVYMFLKHHLAALEPFLGAAPYCQSGR